MLSVFLGDAVIGYVLYGYLTAVPIADQRRDVLSRVEMVLSLLRCVAQCVVLLCSDVFYLYLLTIPATTVVGNLVTAWVVRKRYPHLRDAGELSQDHKRDLGRRVSGLLVERVTAVSRNGVDALCISAFVGLAENGRYSNYSYILTSLIAFSAIVLTSMAAGVGNSVAVEGQEKNYADMRRFDFAYTAVAGWATVCMLCLCQPFVATWLGVDMMLGMPVVMGLCAYFYVLKSGDIRWVYHEGAGLWYEGRSIMIGEAVVNVVLNIVLCRWLGVLGVVLSSLVSVLVANAYFSPELLFRLYFRNGKLGEYMRDHVCYAATMLLSAGLAWPTCEAALPMAMVARIEVISCSLCLGGRLFVCTAVSFLVFRLIWRGSARYEDTRSWLHGLMKTQ